MKTSHAIGITVAAVVLTVAIEESRIAALRSDQKAVETSAASKTTDTLAAQVSPEDGPVRTKGRAELKPAAPEKAADAPEESFAKTARKMWENPAGKSMMNQGIKMAVAMMYEDFIEGLDLSKEEADYFKTLLGKEIAGQQELGMKMMSATPEERKALAEEIQQRSKENEEEIKKFLNSEADYKSFTDYKSRLPERQQIDGLRATMESKGAPLDAETEARLVETMYRARTESNSPDFSGPGAMEEMAKGNIVANYEKSWEKQQEVLRAETAGILNATQQEAFQDYQKQLKDMQLMGLKMAEQMMKGSKDGE